MSGTALPEDDTAVSARRAAERQPRDLAGGSRTVELGLEIKRRSPFANTFVIELANDNCAYVPTRAAFDLGAYEVENSRIAPGGGEALVEEALRLLQDLAS